jgi:hypothetical protein
VYFKQRGRAGKENLFCEKGKEENSKKTSKKKENKTEKN